MFRAYFLSKRWALWAYGGAVALLLSLIAQVHMIVLINDWYQGFYDLLQKADQHQLSDFWDVIVKFCWIAFPYVLLATVTNFLTRMYALRWREAITFDYIPKWRNITHEVEGASQRIQEDTMKLASMIESLGLQIARAAMTLIAFTPVLWGLSSNITFGPLKEIEGSLVWLAILIAVGGMTVSWFVGWWLPGLEYNNQRVEAAFRKELVYGEDDKENFSHLNTLTNLFLGVKINYQRLYLHYGYFDIWLNLYSQLMVIVPFIVVGPGLFLTAMSLGVLMKTVNAFNEVRESLMVLINNWTRITELRSVWKRLREFQKNITVK